jgi:tetratricopeptide (TPR) repeat protein
MKVNAVRRLGVFSLLVAVALFSGCAGAPAPVAEQQAPQPAEIAKARAPEAETAVAIPKADKPLKIIAAARPTTAQHWSEALLGYEDGDSAAALVSVMKVRRAKSDYPGARLLESKLRYRLGDASGGLPLLEELVKRGEGGATAIHTFAKWSDESGRGSNAQSVLEELVATDDNTDPELLAALGWLYQRAGEAGAALELFNLIDGKPRTAAFAPFVAQARFETGDYEGVRELFKRERANGGSASLQVRLAMADVNRMEGRASAAEQGYLRALEAAPENYWAKVNLAILKLGQGDAKGARALLDESAAEHPDRPEAWCNLGLALRELGEHDRALDAYERALAVAPDHPPTLKNIGILWEKYFGEYAKGLSYYDKYLKLVGTDEEVRRWHKAAGRMVGSAQ